MIYILHEIDGLWQETNTDMRTCGLHKARIWSSSSGDQTQERFDGRSQCHMFCNPTAHISNNIKSVGFNISLHHNRTTLASSREEYVNRKTHQKKTISKLKKFHLKWVNNLHYFLLQVAGEKHKKISVI